MDIVAARINLAQYCVLKLLSDPSLCTVSGADSADSAAGPAAAASTVSITTAPHPSLLQQQVLDDYFSGSAVNANMNACVTPGGGGGSPFPYLFSKLRAVKDIYALYFDLKKLRKVVKTANKGTVASCSMNPLDSVRMQLLEVNLEHLLNNFRTLCNALYTHLQLVA